MNKSTFPPWSMAALGLAALALLAGGAWFYRTQERDLRQEAEAELTAIAQLKVNQIAQWRAEQLADAATLASSPFFAEAVARWLAAPQADDTDQILARFRALQTYYHHHDVLLVDTSGQVHLSLSGSVGHLHQDAAQVLAAALAARQPMLSNLHAGPGDLPPHIDAVAPISAGDSPTSEPVGAVVFQNDARQFLYPLIQSWPVPSNSAETLIVRRDGDQVLFLNDPRFQPGAALTLRFPLSQTDLPAVMAVLGQEGLVQGVDYRGAEVLAVLKAVPDSPWFMVAKVDEAEALSIARREATLILALLLGLVLAAAVGVAAIWQHNTSAHYRDLYRAEQRHHATLLSVGDGVIVTGTAGQVELLNPVAEALTGWSQAEACGRPLAEVFCIVNEETRQPLEDPARRVLRKGQVVGLANHTLLVARDGAERPIADSGAPIRSERGEIDGVVLVFRDQAEERAAQQALRESRDRFKSVFEAANVGKSITQPGGQVNVNKAFADMLGYTQEELKGKTWQELTPAGEVEASQKAIDPLLQGRADAARFTKPYLHKDGSYLWADVSVAMRRNEAGQPLFFVTTVVDITKRRQAEEAVQAYSERLEEMVEERTRELHEAQERLIRQEKLAVLGQLAGGIGHELRNPLGAIKNAAYYLNMVLENPDAETREMLGVLDQEVETAEKIITSLLDYARARPPTRRRVDLNAVVRETLSRTPLPDTPGIEVVLQLDKELPLILADPEQLVQVVGNLVRNSIQAMTGGGRLAVRTALESPQWVLVSVADSGTGISAEDLKKIFEPLFTTKAKGIGLGLALVKTLVEGHGGTIGVESRVGEGSTFTVRLPLGTGAAVEGEGA